MEQIANEKNIGFIDFRLAQVDPVDLRGPLMKTDGGKVEWLTPSIWPEEGDGIVFLDELNLAPTSIQNAAYSLVFKNRIGEYELPSGWNVVAAGNKEKHAQVFSMQPPLRNRFYHMEVDVNSKDWRKWALDDSIEKTWAKDNVINPMIMAYLSKQPGHLYKFSPERDQLNFSTPRSWEMASFLLDTGSPYSDLEGCLGKTIASKFGGFLRTVKDMPDIEDILEGEDIVPERTDICYAVCSTLVSAVKQEPEYLARLWEYALILGEKTTEEFAVLLGRDALRSGLDPENEEFGDDVRKAFIKYSKKYKDIVSSQIERSGSSK